MEAGCWMLVTGCLMLDTGYWVQSSSFRVVCAERWIYGVMEWDMLCSSFLFSIFSFPFSLAPIVLGICYLFVIRFLRF